MKVLIIAIVMIIAASLLIFQAVKSGKEDGATIDVFVNNHFSLVQHKNYRETYKTFHKDLQQSISFKEYEAAWNERIEKFGPLLSWEIHTANKSYNLFSNDTEYNVIIHLRFGADKVVAAVRHDWKAEKDSTKLIWTGSAKGYKEPY